MSFASRRRRKYKATTNSGHSYPVAPNRLKGLKITASNQVWVSDITYIATDEGWLYLATVKDRFTREGLGFATGKRITTELAQQALKQALKRRRLLQGLIHRDVQYCSHEYQDLLKEHQITPSMSRKGNLYDNVVAENFFSCLKYEMVYLNKFSTRREAELAVFQYTEGFYNRKRRHEALGRISPKEFRARWELSIRARRHK